MLRQLAISGVLGFICFILSAKIVGQHALSLPLVWWVMPFSAWLTVVGILLFALRLYQFAVGLSREESIRKGKASAGWLLTALLGIAWYRSDPENSISSLKGAIPLSLPIVLGIVIVAIAAIAAMSLATEFGKQRKLAKGAITQLALLTGSVVFGIPLVFLLITSFKEDRDMSSPNGIIWVPRVQRTMQYSDPDNPIYETTYEGHTVQTKLSRANLDGSVLLEITKPPSLQGLDITTTKTKIKVVPQELPLVNANIDGVKADAVVPQPPENGQEQKKHITQRQT